MNFKNLTKFFIILIFLSNFDAVAFATAKSKRDTTTTITSNIIDIKRKTQIIDFIGNVVVKKGLDTMKADKMVVYYKEEKSQQTPLSSNNKDINLQNDSSIERIEAFNNVRILGNQIKARGNKGYYNPKENIFILEEKVVVNNGSSIANGEKFVYNLNTQKGNLIGKNASTKLDKNKEGDKRVVVIIGDDDIKKKKSKKKEKIQ